VLAQDGAQGGLAHLAGGVHVVLDRDHALVRLEHLEVHHGVDLHRDVVLGDHLLRRHVQRDGAQGDLDHFLEQRDQDDQPGPRVPT